MEEKIFDGMKYLISYPEGFQEDRKYPLVVFLHGAGARSENTDRLREHVCIPYILKHQNTKGFILVAPLCNGVNWDEWMTILVRFVDTLRELPYVDKARVHLTGNSMGGYGTWALATLRPDWFASAMPLCGGGSAGFAKKLVGLPIRAFHGLCDKTVDPFESLEMAKSVNLAGGHAELILFPDRGHRIWADVYDDEKNYDWLLSFTNEREKAAEESLVGDYYG